MIDLLDALTKVLEIRDDEVGCERSENKLSCFKIRVNEFLPLVEIEGDGGLFINETSEGQEAGICQAKAYMFQLISYIFEFEDRVTRA